MIASACVLAPIRRTYIYILHYNVAVCLFEKDQKENGGDDCCARDSKEIDENIKSP